MFSIKKLHFSLTKPSFDAISSVCFIDALFVFFMPLPNAGRLHNRKHLGLRFTLSNAATKWQKLLGARSAARWPSAPH